VIPCTIYQYKINLRVGIPLRPPLRSEEAWSLIIKRISTASMATGIPSSEFTDGHTTLTVDVVVTMVVDKASVHECDSLNSVDELAVEATIDVGDASVRWDKLPMEYRNVH